MVAPLTGRGFDGYGDKVLVSGRQGFHRLVWNLSRIKKTPTKVLHRFSVMIDVAPATPRVDGQSMADNNRQ
jgi:hypothetical protein